MKVNNILLPIKLHYLTYFGGIGAIWPFVPIFARQWGFTAIDMGVVASIGFLIGAVLSALVFRMRCFWANKKTTLMATTITLIFIISLMGLILNGVKTSEDEDELHFERPVQLSCDETASKNQLFIRQRREWDGSCMHERVNRKYFIGTEDIFPGSSWLNVDEELNGKGLNGDCDLRCIMDMNICDILKDTEGCARGGKKGAVQVIKNTTLVRFHVKIETTSIRRNWTCIVLPLEYLAFDGKPLWTSCPVSGESVKSRDALILNHCDIKCRKNKPIEQILLGDWGLPQWKNSHEVFFGILFVSGLTMMFLGIVLSDELCLESIDRIKGNRYAMYCHQRLWGAVGSAIFALTAGILVDLQTDELNVSDLTPCFYLAIGLLALSVVADTLLKVGNRPRSMGMMLVAPSLTTVSLLFACLIAGICFGVDVNFSLWFMEDLVNGSISDKSCDYIGWMKILEGAKVFTDNALGEVPMFLIGYKVHQKLGHKLAPVLALLIIGVRMITMSFVQMYPWGLIPFGILRNSGYSLLFHVIFRKSFTSEIARSKGIFASLGSYLLMGALGTAVGSITGGQLISTESSSFAYRTVAALALVSSMILAVVSYFIENRGDSDNLQESLEEGRKETEMLNGSADDRKKSAVDSMRSGSEIGWRESSETGAMKKFKLLLWKNFKIQMRNKFQVVVEVLITLMFTVALVAVRILIPLDKITEPTIFEPFALKGNVPTVLRTVTDALYYTPSNDYTDTLMKAVQDNYFIAEGLNYRFKGFSSEAKMIEAYEKSMEGFSGGKGMTAYNATSSILAGVVFDKTSNSKSAQNLKYTLRFPAYQRTEFDVFRERFTFKPAWFTDLLYHLFRLLGPRSDKAEGGFPGYFAEGFLYLQYAIDTTFTKLLLNSSQISEYEKYDIKMQRFPYPPYSDDKFVFAIQFWLPFFICLSFIYPAMNITKVIVHEKETRLKEFMKMMGLPNWLHWTAWFLKAISFLTISVLLLTILVKVQFSEGRAILTGASGSLLFAVMMCQMITLIGFCFLMSTLFTSANSAATSAGFLWLFLFLPYSFIFPRINSMSRLSKFMTCTLIANTPISYATQIFAMYEGIGSGMSWDTITTGVTPDDRFCILDCMIMMLANGSVYMIAAFYIEIVWPGSYGVGLPWYFPFTTWYWEGKSPPVSDSSLNIPSSSMSKQKSSYFEPPGPEMKVGVDITGLTKVFRKKGAVCNLNLRFYENQITALLGHNGAGKTTTMSMLTGMVTPTRGTAIVNGYDICTDMHSVRTSLGMCPQYDVLFDELTVEEHLKFFSLLKGYDKFEANVEIERMLDALGFEAKRDAQACTLSGGMKRKLSVGIAFCAGSKVVLLDEPTSGMDPGARRSTWDLVQTEKLGRTVILSTHFMEEADLLGDRIAIMANGDLKCCGSSLFLKKRYGGDYRLIIVKEPDCKIEDIADILRQGIPNVEISQDVGAELSFSLPSEFSGKYAPLFQELEERKHELGISSYGVGSTTMEEVFMRSGEISSGHSGGGASTRTGKSGTLKKSSSIHSTLSRKTLTTPLTPTVPKPFTSEKQSMLQHSLDAPRNKGLKLIRQQYTAVFVKKVLLSLRNRNLALLQIVIPLALVLNSITAIKTVPDINAPVSHLLTLDRYEYLGKTTTAVACESGKHRACKGYKNFLTEKYQMEEVRGTSFIDFIMEKELEDLPKTESQYMIGFEQRSKLTRDPRGSKSVELVAFFNNQPFHTPPLALNFMANGILRGFGLQSRITVTNFPFDYIGVDDIKQSGNFFTGGFLISWVIAFGTAFLGGSFIIFPVSERVTKSKHLQFVAGIKYPIYWSVGYITDMFNYMIPCALIMVVLFILGMDEFTHFEVVCGYFALSAACSWAIISLMSLCSFAFTIPSSGYARMVAFTASAGLLTMIVVTILDVPEFNIQDVTETLHDVFLLVPNYAFGMGIVQLTSHYKLHQFCHTMDLDKFCAASPDFVCCTKYQESYYSWKPAGIGKNLVCLLSFGLVCTTALALIESRIFYKLKALMQYQNEWETAVSTSTGEEAPLDDDVDKEKQRINSKTLASLSKTDTLILRNLTKIYDNNFLAVDHLTLGVGRGETFGLLGVNGAGKTTTFKMLTGDIPITQGDAYLTTFSVRKNVQKVHENLGYCPQFDALIEQLTGRENLRLFARLRGIKEDKIDGIIAQLSENLIFTQHIDKQVQEYSGGNKRKLSTALAMLGNPPVVFLDEPTTGMDPVARRHVWNAISAIRDQGTSVVLTSHSMEECEALCSKLAIMVNGRFQCLGSPQHLKNKFGEGYTIVAQLAYSGLNASRPSTRHSELSDVGSEEYEECAAPQWEMELADLKRYIETSLEGCQLTDTHPGFVQYHVSSENTTWAKLFAVMEKAKDMFKLEAYSVGQTSLDQVFFNFTQLQQSSED